MHVVVLNSVVLQLLGSSGANHVEGAQADTDIVSPTIDNLLGRRRDRAGRDSSF